MTEQESLKNNAQIDQDIERNIMQESQWENFGKRNGFTNLRSWRQLKMQSFKDWGLQGKSTYFKSLLTHEPADLQSDVGDSLTATGIISVLVLSVTSDVLIDPLESANSNNIFGDAAEAFSYISQILGIASFAFACLGTFYSVNFYSQVIRIPTDAFSAYLESVGQISFGLIWVFPSFAIYCYLAATVINIMLAKSLGLGIYSVCISSIAFLITFRVFFKSDSLHGLATVLISRFRKELALLQNKQEDLQKTDTLRNKEQ